MTVVVLQITTGRSPPWRRPEGKREARMGDR
jgi:hypothetical protein